MLNLDSHVIFHIGAEPGGRSFQYIKALEFYLNGKTMIMYIDIHDDLVEIKITIFFQRQNHQLKL